MDTTFSVDRQGETIESKVDSLRGLIPRGKQNSSLFKKIWARQKPFPKERLFSISKRISEAKLWKGTALTGVCA